MASPLTDSRQHFDSCHQRWSTRLNRRQGTSDYRDEWYAEQCGICRYFIPLCGAFIEDYGGCTNGASEFDGMIRFEHDGCDHFSEGGDWGPLASK